MYKGCKSVCMRMYIYCKSLCMYIFIRLYVYKMHRTSYILLHEQLTFQPMCRP